MIAACRPFWTALNADLNAISVFPKPTSPQIMRSIDLSLSHVDLHRLERRDLVWRLFKWKAGFENLLPRRYLVPLEMPLANILAA